MARKHSADFSHSLGWSIRLRWIILTLFLVFAIILRQFLPVRFFYIILFGFALEYAYNILLYISHKYYFRLTNFCAYLSPVVDTLVIVSIMYFTGWLNLYPGNLYIIPLIYTIPIITTSVVLSMAAGLAVAVMAALLLALLYLYGFFNGILPVDALFAAGEKALYFLIIAFLSGYLAKVAKEKSHALEDSKQNIGLKNKTLLKAQEQLIQSEKMSSITEITVSLNHAINNPLTSVLADVQFVLLKLKTKADDPQTIQRSISCLQTAEKEAIRIKNIMEDLRHLTKPVVEDYIPGIKMIDLEKSISLSKENKAS